MRFFPQTKIDLIFLRFSSCLMGSGLKIPTIHRFPILITGLPLIFPDDRLPIVETLFNSDIKGVNCCQRPQKTCQETTKWHFFQPAKPWPQPPFKPITFIRTTCSCGSSVRNEKLFLVLVTFCQEKWSFPSLFLDAFDLFLLPLSLYFSHLQFVMPLWPDFKQSSFIFWNYRSNESSSLNSFLAFVSKK